MVLSLLAEPEQLQPQPQLQPGLLPRRIVEADLACLMCGQSVGVVVKGKAYHHNGCSRTLRVERGLLRCCQCHGPVLREAVAPLTRH